MHELEQSRWGLFRGWFRRLSGGFVPPNRRWDVKLWALLCPSCQDVVCTVSFLLRPNEPRELLPLDGDPNGPCPRCQADHDPRVRPAVRARYSPSSRPPGMSPWIIDPKTAPRQLPSPWGILPPLGDLRTRTWGVSICTHCLSVVCVIGLCGNPTDNCPTCCRPAGTRPIGEARFEPTQVWWMPWTWGRGRWVLTSETRARIEPKMREVLALGPSKLTG